MRIAKNALKMIQAARKQRFAVLDLGRCIEARKRGMAGRRNRGSWWGIRERIMVEEMADRRGRRGREILVRGRRKREGPRRRGRETRRCW